MIGVRRSTVASEGIDLSVLTGGATGGRPIVFLHGLGFSGAIWRKQLTAPELAPFHLIALDLRGHGASRVGPDDALDETSWRADLQALADRFALRDAVAVAWSYAGLVIADVLKAAGEGVFGAVNLVAAATRAGTPEAMSDFGEAAVPQDLLSDDPARSSLADRDFVHACAGATPFPPDEASELTALLGSTPRSVLRQMLRRVVVHDPWWEQWHRPTLVSHGTHDRINLPVISDRLISRLPHGRLSTYDGCGHLPFWERPQRFNAELREFVRSPGTD